jgi:hypothetical protein
MKLGIYVMAPELCVYPFNVARRRLGKTLPRQRIQTQQKRIIGNVFYTVRVVSKESRRLVLRTFCLIPLRSRFVLL